MHKSALFYISLLLARISLNSTFRSEFSEFMDILGWLFYKTLTTELRLEL